MTPAVDDQHPIIDIIFEGLVPAGDDGLGMAISAEGRTRIEAAVRAALEDGSLRACRRDGFAMIGFLAKQPGTEPAVETLKDLAKALGPEVEAAAAESEREHDEQGARIKARFAQMSGEQSALSAPNVDDPAPKGSVKASDLAPPRRIIR